MRLDQRTYYTKNDSVAGISTIGKKIVVCFAS